MTVQADVEAWVATSPRVYKPGFTVAENDRYFGSEAGPKTFSPDPPPEAGVFAARTPDEAYQLAFYSFRRSFPNVSLDDFRAAMILENHEPQFVDGRFVIEVSP